MHTNSNSAFTRREFLAATTAAGLALAVPRFVFSQEEGLVPMSRKSAAMATLNVQKLRGNVTALLGAGGNIAVLPGKDGKFLVDGGLGGARSKIADALAGLSKDPVKHLVNTHWHFDHTDGNEWLHAAGAAITAHENTRKHLATTTRVVDWDFTFPPAAKGAIPTEPFSEGRSMKLNGATIVLKHYQPAHTDGDVWVYFTEADILHTGDTFWNGAYPFIDYSTGGSIDGMIRATEANLAQISDKSIVIPGHGPVGNKSDLTIYRDLLVGVREKIATLKKQGKSIEEVVSSKPTAATDEKWGGGFMNPAKFAWVIYQGV
jgi:glyoxylase-like metal-dependent hydrolase (beta-lactamase superfamily II)